MNKKVVQKTALSYWSDEDECFITTSPLFEAVIGAGDTEKESKREFDDLLSDAYEAYLEGRLNYERVGRPAKHRIALNTDVMQQTKESIKIMAQELDCSQGEVIDYLYFFYNHKKSYSQAKVSAVSDSDISITDLYMRVSELEKHILTAKTKSSPTRNQSKRKRKLRS